MNTQLDLHISCLDDGTLVIKAGEQPLTTIQAREVGAYLKALGLTHEQRKELIRQGMECLSTLIAHKLNNEHDGE